jgi:hypothetical protein
MKQLYSIQRNGKREGKRVTLVRDRLYINNELYIVSEENELNGVDELHHCHFGGLMIGTIGVTIWNKVIL